MNHDNDAALFIFLYVFGFLILIWVMYAIIRSANDTTTRNRIQLQNQKLLALIAEKLGVDPERIKKVIQGDDYRPPKPVINEVEEKQ